MIQGLQTGGSLSRKPRVEQRQRLGGEALPPRRPRKDHRIRQLERTLGRKSLEIEILKNVVGE
jgi:hypothetical protein